MLVYASTGVGVTTKGKLKVHQMLPISTLSVRSLWQETFALESPVKSFLVTANDSNIKMKWLSKLKQAIVAKKMEKRSPKEPMGSKRQKRRGSLVGRIDQQRQISEDESRKRGDAHRRAEAKGSKVRQFPAALQYSRSLLKVPMRNLPPRIVKSLIYIFFKQATLGDCPSGYKVQIRTG